MPNDLRKKNGPPYAEGGYDDFYDSYNLDESMDDKDEHQHDTEQGVCMRRAILVQGVEDGTKDSVEGDRPRSI